MFILTRVEGLPSIADANLSLMIVSLFFLSVTAIYFVSFVLWRKFYGLFGCTRISRDAFVDTGLIAIGKYVPGKIWGLLFRGALSKDTVTFNKTRIAISGFELIYTLVIGLLLVGFLGVITLPGINLIKSVILGMTIFTVSISLLPLASRWLSHSTFFSLQFDAPSLTANLQLCIGYFLMWLMSAVPIVILIASNQALTVTQLSAVGAAFLGSMIVGWIALFAPGGIGVRESVFVLLAPSFLTWQEGLFWIALHRTLFTAFDLVYGVIAISTLAYRTRSVVVR